MYPWVCVRVAYNVSACRFEYRTLEPRDPVSTGTDQNEKKKGGKEAEWTQLGWVGRCTLGTEEREGARAVRDKRVRERCVCVCCPPPLSSCLPVCPSIHPICLVQAKSASMPARAAAPTKPAQPTSQADWPTTTTSRMYTNQPVSAAPGEMPP